MDIGQSAMATEPVISPVGLAMPLVQSPSVVIQRVMNLVMPIVRTARMDDDGRPVSDVLPATKARLVLALAQQRDAITTGLDNLGTIHFARFNIVGDDLHLISVYDGTAQSYVQDFAVQLGPVFDVILSFVADWPRDEGTPWSVRDHPSEFLEWVLAHDLLQIPRDPTQSVGEALRRGRGSGRDVRSLTLGALTSVFEQCPSAHLSMHRGYPGRSVAQIREALEVGW